MSQTSHEPDRASVSGVDESIVRRTAPRSTPARTQSATFQGWAYFGAAVMVLLGLFWAVLGVATLFDKEFFTVRSNRLLALHSYSSWGWVHLVGGVVAVAAGVGIIGGGRRWARTLGIVVAGVSAIVNLGFLAATPVWSGLLIALDVVVIYALTVHGWEIDDS